MPAVAVAAAFFAVEAAVTVTTVFSVITAVGAVVGAVGAVTGNKDLMRIGMVVGIVGGLGTLASNAGMFGEAAADIGASGVPDAAAESAANAAAGAGDAITGTATTGMASNAQNAAAAASTPASAVPSPADIGGAVTPAPTVPADAASAVVAAPTVPDATAAVAAPAAPTDVVAPPPPTPDYSQVGSDIKSTFDSNLQTPIPSVANKGDFENWASTFKDLGKSSMDWANKNPLLASSLMNGIGSAADPSQRNLREAQTNASNANAAYTNTLTNNMNAKIPQIDWSKYFKQPGAKPTGMAGRGA